MADAPAAIENSKLLLEAIKTALSIVGGVLAAGGTVVGFLLTRYWNKRDRDADSRERELESKQAEYLKFRETLYDSLKWFEGGRQKRSLGIAVVETSWEEYPKLHRLWIEVLTNQAIYLLAASKSKDSAHEQENLRRILEILGREKSLITVAICEDQRQGTCRQLAGRTHSDG